MANSQDEIIVSVLCPVYNHEDYIQSALEGFVSQKTNFRFEVIVHDDASIDRSAEIIRLYEKKYPNLIKPIYQTENQLSQKIPVSQTYLYPAARGKYIALCEGDDYWIDEYKLQKQVDYMESHPDCSFCFTNAFCEEDGTITRNVIPWGEDSVISSKDNYDMCGIEKLGYIPTCSFLFPRACYKNLPDIDKKAFHGDGFLKLGLTMQGYAHYMDEQTCVYRFGVPGSSTTRWKKDPVVFSSYADRFIRMYKEFDRITEGKYHELFDNRALNWEVQNILRSQNYKNLKDKRYKAYFAKKGAKAMLRYYTICYLTPIYKLHKKLRGN